MSKHNDLLVAAHNGDDAYDYAALLVPAHLALWSGRLVGQLRAAGVPDPLGQPLTLAAVLYDLFTIAGAPVPAEIRARLEV